VVAPTPPAAESRHAMRWTSLGAILGLAAGLLGGWYYHSKQPGEFESTARLQVTGPPPAADAETQIAILRSKAVAERAAVKLDDLRPFEMPPPKEIASRAAYLEKGLSVAAEIPTDGGSTLDVTFRGPHRADTPKYLRAIVDAYKVEATSRSAPARPTPAPAAKPSPPAPPPPTAQPDAEIERLKQKLAALTKDDFESRLGASRTAAGEVTVKLAGIDRDLALIRSAGSSRRDRQAVMEELGIKADSAPASSTNAAEIHAAEEQLRSLQFKKAELGQRLGPEHRDMIALDEQLKLAKERLAKATPPAKGPDELDAYRSKLAGERTALAAQAGVLAASVATDEKRIAEVHGLRKQLEELTALRPGSPPVPAPRETPAPPTETGPTAFAVQATVPSGEGERVSPPLYRSLVPGGVIGLFSGAALGLIGALLFASSPKPVRPRPKARVPISPPIRTSTASVQMTSGPKLGIPVFANVPAIRPELQPEKRSAEGLSPLLVAFSQPSGAEAEIFRIARRELTNALQNRGHQVVLITSPGPGDGKSLIAANLAVSLAQAGKLVILVDGDLKSAKVQELFRLTRLGDSLKSIMASEVDLRMAVRSCEVPNLFLLPAGRGPMDPADLLARPKFRELIAELKSSYEYVIIDAPSTLAEKEFAALAGTADGVVLVVRSGPDVLSRSDRARGQIIEAGARVLGAIVNAAPPSRAAAQPELPESKELVASLRE
jgi:capsular exopolysaccharide synthesis family protein